MRVLSVEIHLCFWEVESGLMLAVRICVFVIKWQSFKHKEVTEAIQKVAAAYDCKIVEGVLGYQLKQFVIVGNKVLLSVPGPETRVDDAEFQENEVYAIDIVASAGEGKKGGFYEFGCIERR